MMRATSQFAPPFDNLSAGLTRLLRPAVGFHHPDDVLKDPDLTLEDKRAILASWASDACAVQDQPHLRWLLGSPEPAPLFEVQDAISRLERRARAANSATGPASKQPPRRPDPDAGRPSA